MEGCSVCTCEEGEIPKPWLEAEGKRSKQKDEYGWITSQNSDFGYEGQGIDDSLGRISVAEGESPDLRLDSMYKDALNGNGKSGLVEVDLGTSNGIQSEMEFDDDDDDDSGTLPRIV